jgi:hypothetical protein
MAKKRKCKHCGCPDVDAAIKGAEVHLAVAQWRNQQAETVLAGRPEAYALGLLAKCLRGEGPEHFDGEKS